MVQQARLEAVRCEEEECGNMGVLARGEEKGGGAIGTWARQRSRVGRGAHAGKGRHWHGRSAGSRPR